ncbi:hypothetical protein ROI_11340 [Roseburia intestinalis M50/1]|nr:hypothetical protein ROI_11340 [Roseburia intestinalis M50/1]
MWAESEQCQLTCDALKNGQKWSMI